MKPKRDDCKSIEELIHLSVDGRLDVERVRRLEKHLAACERCAEKLMRLQATEAGARSIGLDEPPPEYWSAFSRRVMEKIETSAVEKPAWSWASAFAGLFAAPRLRIAAGVASLAVVVIVGALFLRDRGRIVPSVPVRDKVVTVSEAARTAEPEAAQTAEPQTAPKPAPAVEEKAEPPVVVEAPASLDAAAPSPVVAEPSSVVVAETSKERAPVTDSARQITRESRTEPVAGMANTFAEKKDAGVSMLLKTGRTVAAAKGEGFMLDGGAVPRVSAADTSMSEAALRGVIQKWRSHIERNPLDPQNNRGYVQAADAYYLLARLTRDEAVVSEGAQLVQEYANRVDDPGLKLLLLDSKARIESFRGK